MNDNKEIRIQKYPSGRVRRTVELLNGEWHGTTTYYYNDETHSIACVELWDSDRFVSSTDYSPGEKFDEVVA